MSSKNVSKAITIQHGCEYMHNFILLSKIEQKLSLISVKPVQLLGRGGETLQLRPPVFSLAHPRYESSKAGWLSVCRRDERLMKRTLHAARR